MKLKIFVSLVVTMALITTLTAQDRKSAGGDPDLAKKIARFAPTTLTAGVSRLSAKDRQALEKIIAAAKLLDPLFLRQVWAGNAALEQKLLADKTPAGRQRLHYFYINDGPWSRLDDKEPFIEGAPKEKPPQANYLPRRHDEGGVQRVGGNSFRSRQTESHRVFLAHPARRG